MRTLWLLALLTACGEPGGKGDEAGAASIERGVRFLVAAQSPDGAVRSRTYGALKDGLSLTPSVAKALVFAPEVEGAAFAADRALDFLASTVRDAEVDGGPARAREGLAIMGLQLDATGCRWK